MASPENHKPKKRGEIPTELEEIEAFQRDMGLPGQNILLYDDARDVIDSLVDTDSYQAEPMAQFQAAAEAGIKDLFTTELDTEADQVYAQYNAERVEISGLPEIIAADRPRITKELYEVSRLKTQRPLYGEELDEFISDAQYYIDSLPEVEARQILQGAVNVLLSSIQTTDFESPADEHPEAGHFIETRKGFKKLPTAYDHLRKPKPPS